MEWEAARYLIKQINVTEIEAFELNYNQGKSKDIQLCYFRFMSELIPTKILKKVYLQKQNEQTVSCLYDNSNWM